MVYLGNRKFLPARKTRFNQLPSFFIFRPGTTGVDNLDGRFSKIELLHHGVHGTERATRDVSRGYFITKYHGEYVFNLMCSLVNKLPSMSAW